MGLRLGGIYKTPNDHLVICQGVQGGQKIHTRSPSLTRNPAPLPAPEQGARRKESRAVWMDHLLVVESFPENNLRKRQSITPPRLLPRATLVGMSLCTQ